MVKLNSKFSFGNLCDECGVYQVLLTLKLDKDLIITFQVDDMRYKKTLTKNCLEHNLGQ
jgi:hypothetical protein